MRLSQMFCLDQRNYSATDHISVIACLNPRFLLGLQGKLTTEENVVYKVLLSWFWSLMSYLVILCLKEETKAQLCLCPQDADYGTKICSFPHSPSTWFVLLDLLLNSSFHWVSSVWHSGSRALCCHNGLGDRKERGFSTPSARGRAR